MKSSSKYIYKLVFLQIFFIICIDFSVIAQCNESKCDKGYIVNVNGENRCIDTTELFYQPFYQFNSFMHDSIIYYSSWFYTITMKIFNEQKWDVQDSIKDKMRILLFDAHFDTIFLYTFPNTINDTLHFTIKKMAWYNVPLKHPLTTVSKINDSTYSYCFFYMDSIVCTTNKTRFDRLVDIDYTENYGKIDTVTYTTAEYQIPRKEFQKLQKSIANLQNYNAYTELLIDIILMEYVSNEEYHITFISISELEYQKDKFFKRNRQIIMEWLNKYM